MVAKSHAQQRSPNATTQRSPDGAKQPTCAQRACAVRESNSVYLYLCTLIESGSFPSKRLLEHSLAPISSPFSLLHFLFTCLLLSFLL